MHVETLKTFCDLVETGSLSRAARLNLVSQSAVSQQLRALEQRYGGRLIDRAPRIGARPTELGRLLYEEIKPFLERLAALEQRLRARPDVVAGTVRVATVYSVGLHTLPPVIKRCLADHPKVSVQLSYRRTDEVYAACLAGDVDFGIVAVPARRAQLEVVPLGHDELVIAAPPGHPIARRARCSLAALDGQPFIGFQRDIPTRRMVDGLLRRHGVRVSYAMELDNVETIKRSVEAGLGVSLLPAPTLVERDPRAHAGGPAARRGPLPPSHRRHPPAHARAVGPRAHLPIPPHLHTRRRRPIRAHLLRYGALGRALNVEGVRLAPGLRAPPRIWTLLGRLLPLPCWIARQARKLHGACACLLWDYASILRAARGASNAVRGESPSMKTDRHTGAASRVDDPIGGTTNGQDHTCRQL